MLGKKAAKSKPWVQLIDPSGCICNLALKESAAVTGVLCWYGNLYSGMELEGVKPLLALLDKPASLM